MSQGFEYRKVFYKDYFNSQSGRVFHLNIENKMKAEQYLLSAEITPLLPADKTSSILDIGCGFGSLIYTLKQKGYTQLKGIDLSEGQVKVAHELGLKEVEQQDLIDYLTKHTNSFDVITGLDIIEHFSKDELMNVLTLVKNALKHNGTAIFRTPNLDAPFASIFSNGDFTHENYMNSSSAKQVMTNIGFTDIKVLPSLMKTQGFMKELFRKITWTFVKAGLKLIIFSTGRSSQGIIFTPNMLISVRRSG